MVFCRSSRQLAGKLFWLGLGGLLSDLKFTLASSSSPGARRPTVEVRGKLPRADVAVLLLWMKAGYLHPSASPSWFRRRRRHPLPIRRTGVQQMRDSGLLGHRDGCCLRSVYRASPKQRIRYEEIEGFSCRYTSISAVAARIVSKNWCALRMKHRAAQAVPGAI